MEIDFSWLFCCKCFYFILFVGNWFYSTDEKSKTKKRKSFMNLVYFFILNFKKKSYLLGTMSFIQDSCIRIS